MPDKTAMRDAKKSEQNQLHDISGAIGRLPVRVGSSIPAFSRMRTIGQFTPPFPGAREAQETLDNKKAATLSRSKHSETNTAEQHAGV